MTRKTASSKQSGTTGTRAITRALEVLCCFTPHRHEWGISELSEYLGYSRSVIHRILSTLEQENFVIRTEQHRYRPGTRALELGQTSRVANRLVWEAEPRLDALAATVRGVAHLAILEGQEVVELARSTIHRTLTPKASPRTRMPVHATALGKVLLAYSPQELRERFLANRVQFTRYTEHTICSPAMLRRQLELTATQGYALDNEECKIGHRCLAIPVLDPGSNLVAALSVSKRVTQFRDADLDGMLKQLLLSARSLAEC